MLLSNLPDAAKRGPLSRPPKPKMYDRPRRKEIRTGNVFFGTKAPNAYKFYKKY